MYDIAIAMGSKSDLKTMQPAIDFLNTFQQVRYRVHIVSAHRTPDWMMSFAKNAIRQYRCIIAAAGGAAHLPGMIAASTTLPVIGVPVSSHLQGVDSLLSIVQMPAGVPVGTMSIGIPGAKNAVLYALRILSVGNPAIADMLSAYAQKQANMVDHDNQQLQQ